MNKPTPKAELVTKLQYENHIAIWTASQDAYDWISQEAIQFGMLFKPGSMSMEHFDLIVSPLYDVADVMSYLRSYLEGQS